MVLYPSGAGWDLESILHRTLLVRRCIVTIIRYSSIVVSKWLKCPLLLAALMVIDFRLPLVLLPLCSTLPLYPPSSRCRRIISGGVEMGIDVDGSGNCSGDVYQEPRIPGRRFLRRHGPMQSRSTAHCLQRHVSTMRMRPALPHRRRQLHLRSAYVSVSSY